MHGLNSELHKQYLILVVMNAIQEEVCVGMRVNQRGVPGRSLPSLKSIYLFSLTVSSLFGRGPQSARTLAVV